MGIVYCARNKTNGKIYIGKTMKTLDWRRSKHEGMANSSKYHFHMALSKHGISSFTWSILDESDDEDVLSEMEKEYIDMFSSSIDRVGYNKTHGGDGVSATFETRQKISRSNSGKVRTPEMISNMIERQKLRFKTEDGYWLGKKRDSDVILKLQAGKLAYIERNGHHMTGKHHTEESKAKIRATKALAQKDRPCVCLDCFQPFLSYRFGSMFCSGNCKSRFHRSKRKQEALP